MQRETGELCTPSQLTEAEQLALQTLRSDFAPGTAPDASAATVDASLQAAFAGAPCIGLAYAGEQARRVYGGVQPRETLMPGVG